MPLHLPTFYPLMDVHPSFKCWNYILIRIVVVIVVLLLVFIFTASVLVSCASRFCNDLHLYSATCLTSVLLLHWLLHIFGRFFYVEDILARWEKMILTFTNCIWRVWRTLLYCGFLVLCKWLKWLFFFFFSNSHIWQSWKESLLETAQYCNKVHDSSHLQGQHFFGLASVNCCSHFQKFE